MEPARGISSVQPVARSRSRWDLAVFAVVLLGPASLWSAVLVSRNRVSPLEKRLVSEVSALLSDPGARPPHVDSPLPGSFADASAAALDQLPSAARHAPLGTAAYDDYLDGTEPLQALPETARAGLAELRPVATALLQATHAERAGPQHRLSALSCLDAGEQPWTALRKVGLWAALEVRRELEASRPERALELCLDGLAFGRDVSIGTGVPGRSCGAEIQSLLNAPCLSALDLASPAAKRKALRSLQAILQATPLFSDLVRQDSLALQLRVVGPALDEWALQALPPLGREAVRSAMEKEKPVWFLKLAYRDGWADLVEAYDALAAAMDLPAEERLRAMADLHVLLDRRANPIAKVSIPRGYRKQLEQHLASQTFIAALALGGAADLYRAEHGKWPGSVEEIARFGSLELKLDPRTQPISVEVNEEGLFELGVQFFVPLELPGFQSEPVSPASRGLLFSPDTRH